jgi:methyl-accepting chemotaxis protein
MSSKRIGLNLAAKLMRGAVFFLLAFVVYQIVIGTGLSKIGKKSAIFYQETKRVNSFIQQALTVTDQLSKEYMVSMNKITEGAISDFKISTFELQKLLDKEKSLQGFSTTPEYFQKGISDISLLSKKIGSESSFSDKASDDVPNELSQINQILQGLIVQQISATESFGSTMKANQGKFMKNIFMWMTLTFLVVMFIYVLIIRSVKVNVERTLRFAKQISSGNLTAVSEVTDNDEIGQINDALGELKDKLREVLNSIKDISQSIMNAGNEFNSGSQLISGGASSQAASSEEISAAMEQIAEVIKQSADNASETGRIAQHAFDGIQHGANQVESALSVIEDIAQKNSVIGEISYQTKILSINASVEAARAAEVGRGFAVVAEEVKRLAETTQSSASEINKVSKKGVVLARKSANELRELVSEFQRTSELVNQIAEAGNEHINTITQINFSLQDLNNITQQNASSAEELAASSDELVKLTQSLDSLISYFKLEEDLLVHENFHGEIGTGASNDENQDNDKWTPLSFLSEKEEKEEEQSTPKYIWEETPVVEETKPRFDEVEKPLSAPVINTAPLEEKPIKSKPKEEKVKVHPKGVRINLTDNDDLDSQFEKMK